MRRLLLTRSGHFASLYANVGFLDEADVITGSKMDWAVTLIAG